MPKHTKASDCAGWLLSSSIIGLGCSGEWSVVVVSGQWSVVSGRLPPSWAPRRIEMTLHDGEGGGVPLLNEQCRTRGTHCSAKQWHTPESMIMQAYLASWRARSSLSEWGFRRPPPHRLRGPRRLRTILHGQVKELPGGMSNAAMCRWFGCPRQRRNAEWDARGRTGGFGRVLFLCRQLLHHRPAGQVHTLDSDDDLYSRFWWSSIPWIWMKHHTLDFDDHPYPRFGWNIIL